MKKYVLILYCLFFIQLVFSQSISYEIKGTIKGVMDSIPLASATIYLHSIKNNDILTYTTSDNKGTFILNGKTTQKKATLFISYVGSKTYTKTLTVKEKIDLKHIYLENNSMLDAIIITARAPVIIKQDTLEFNPNAFKNRKEASVEDFIKILPGAQVNRSGNITINGKPVDKILVNGKPFFTNDLTIATQNLTKAIIEKLQITDSKTNSEAFAGEEGDGEYKTINLVIKEENNKGAFGKLTTGIGDDNRYELSGIYNRFSSNRNMSFLIKGDNINASRSSFGTNGITTSKKMGITYAEDIVKNHALSINYLYSKGQFENQRIKATEYIVPETPYFSMGTSTSNTKKGTHSIVLGYTAKINPTLHVDFMASYDDESGESLYKNDSETLDEFKEQTNTSISNSKSFEKGNDFINTINFTKKIGAKGVFINFYIDYGMDQFKNEDFMNSEILFTNTSTDPVFRNQFTDSYEKENYLKKRITFRIPIVVRKMFVDFEYATYKRLQESNKAVFDLNEDVQVYTLFNNQLSSYFNYKNRIKTPKVKLKYHNEKLKAFIDFKYAFKTIENQNKLQPNLDIKRSFKVFTYKGGIDYKLSKRIIFNSGIGLLNELPSLSQLQPFTNVSDPLNSIRGNPDLKPQNKYTMSLNFRANNFKKGFGFYSLLKANYNRNSIASKYTINDDLIRETTYVNVNGNYGHHFFLNIYKNIKLDALRKMRIQLDGAISSTKQVNFNNDIRYYARTTNYDPSFGLDFEWKNAFDFNMNYNWNYTKSKYSINGFDFDKIITHQLDMDAEIQLLENLRWINKFRYLYNPNVSGNFEKSAWSWNTELGYRFDKEKLNISMKMYNVLNQNINTRRIVTTNYIQNTQNLALQRFVMLSLSWRFNTFKKRLK